mmetsp:Transcript_3030/g.10917  ORF Transcript_3030/g.10917 Transcript_3030/m.10917 type:complete len:181 (+) Transcript_3030:99-641(+)
MGVATALPTATAATARQAARLDVETRFNRNMRPPARYTHRPQARRRLSATCGSCVPSRGVRMMAEQGGGVIDRPTTTPDRSIEFDLGTTSKTQKPPEYRVMLHNDDVNRREYVVQVLLKVIDGLTVDDAVNVMQEAHVNGLACVIQCGQEQAENYCEQLRSNGLISTIEPANSGGGKSSE